MEGLRPLSTERHNNLFSKHGRSARDFQITWIRNLCPPALSDYYIEGPFDPDNKDSILPTATDFIFNLDDYFAGITARKINEPHVTIMVK
ncbi:MAG: hypothetical protein J5I94_15610 [Phaeodactylibacter sp.]|nr:hypothetical protein [Phaeodactylibacter sp.]